MVNANIQVQKEREALLTRRRRRRNNGNDTEMNMLDLAEESGSLASSQNMVGDLLNSGQAQLNSLIEQRNRMRGVKRVVLAIGNKIGLSNQTMGMISKRDTSDAYLVFGGMIVTCFVFYIVWFR
jgi:Golgi SNAP receptor complex protein 2